MTQEILDLQSDELGLLISILRKLENGKIVDPRLFTLDQKRIVRDCIHYLKLKEPV